MMQRFLIGSAQVLGEDEVAVIAITAGVKRDGDEWVPAGVDLTAYRRNPVVLFSHDIRRVIGVAALALSRNQIEGRIQFAPAGISAHADEARGLAKAGVLTGVSAGVNPLQTEPLDPRRPYDGQRFIRSELLEISLVAVGADTDARVIARSYDAATLRRRLPAIPPGALDLLRRAPAQTAAERDLHTAAAEYGESLSAAQVRHFVMEARQLNTTPAYRYRSLRGSERLLASDDRAERQREARDLRECP